jgi:hypothetical protein
MKSLLSSESPGKYITHLVAVILFTRMISLAGCAGITPGDMKITRETVLDSVPSGSGLVLRGDTAHIVGDDATGVYLVNVKDTRHSKIPIAKLNHRIYREPKNTKHDFEAATFVSWKGIDYMLAFGSGSDNPARDSLLLMNLSDPGDNKIISIERFYKKLQEQTGTPAKQWNIEGATVVDTSLVLFNRGNNMIIRMPTSDFMSYVLNDGLGFPVIEFTKISLPHIGSHEARLSGASTLNNEFIVFSASVEDTPDWTEDGPILGSIIGVYSLKEKKVIRSSVLKNARGVVLKEKIESLDAVGKQPGGPIKLIAISDNDNGTSTLWEIELKK